MQVRTYLHILGVAAVLMAVIIFAQLAVFELRGEPTTPPSVSCNCGESRSDGILDTLYKIHCLKEGIDGVLALEIACHVRHYSEGYTLNPDLVLAIIDVESKFDPEAENVFSGARGLMQVMPIIWADELGISPDDLFNPRINIKAGTYVLDHYRRFFGGDMDLAIAAYWQGPQKTMQEVDFGTIDENKYLVEVKRVYKKIQDL